MPEANMTVDKQKKCRIQVTAQDKSTAS